MRHAFEVQCPCCGARLTIDPALGAIVHSASNHPQGEKRDLNRASEVLEQEAARRDHLFRKSLESQKTKSDLLEQKFEEALKKNIDSPAPPPLRDIDLD